MERNYLEELKQILDSNLSNEQKKEQLLQYHESDIADLLEELDEEERKKVYDLLGDESVADIFSHVENVDEYVDELSADKAADIIEKMDADDAIDVLDELDEDRRDEIVSLLDKEAREDIVQIASYDEDELGSKMTNNYVVIHTTDNVKSAMKQVIKEAADNDNVSNIFVLNDDETFYGVLELRELIIARQNDDLLKKIKTNYPYFYDKANISDVLPDLKEYGLDSYPILNEKNELVGVVTADDVVEAVDDEMGDDYAKFAGLTEEIEQGESVFSSVKKRIPWLIILLVLGLVQSFSMTGFESVIASLPIIVFFQTLVLDMAGNSGTQSLAVTIRLLSDKPDSGKEIFKSAAKEFLTGLLNGLILGALSFAFVVIFLFITKQSVHPGEVFSWGSALRGGGIVGIALLIAMSVSSLVGALVPIIFMKIHIDPAVASGPFITTINDITALLIYYGLAYVLFLTF